MLSKIDVQRSDGTVIVKKIETGTEHTHLHIPPNKIKGKSCQSIFSSGDYRDRRLVQPRRRGKSNPYVEPSSSMAVHGKDIFVCVDGIIIKLDLLELKAARVLGDRAAEAASTFNIQGPNGSPYTPRVSKLRMRMSQYVQVHDTDQIPNNAIVTIAKVNDHRGYGLRLESGHRVVGCDRNARTYTLLSRDEEKVTGVSQESLLVESMEREDAAGVPVVAKFAPLESCVEDSTFLQAVVWSCEELNTPVLCENKVVAATIQFKWETHVRKRFMIECLLNGCMVLAFTTDAYFYRTTREWFKVGT